MDRYTRESSHHIPIKNVSTGWNPTGSANITPLKLQILCACEASDVSSRSIPFLANKLGVKNVVVKDAFNELIQSRMLICCISSLQDTYALTCYGSSILANVAIRKPEMLHMTRVLLQKVH